MKTLTLILLSILSWQANVNTNRSLDIETTKEANTNRHFDNRFQNAEVFYTLTMLSKRSTLEDKVYTLRTNSRQSIYMLENYEETPDETQVYDLGNNRTRQHTKRRLYNYSNIFKDFETGKIYEQRLFIEDLYLIEKDITFRDWEITDETMEISGFICKKATSSGTLGNIKTVWFTEEIPISDGPESLYGLPGLILMTESPIHRIYATKISFPEHLTIMPFTQGKKVSIEEMNKLQREFISTAGQTIKKGDSSIRVTVDTIK